MAPSTGQAILDFYTYPPIGGDDWRYAFETAQVRTYEMALLGPAILQDMANAPDFDRAAELLGGTEYALQARRDFAEAEAVLRDRRAAVRELFGRLMLDKPYVRLFKSRDDFANLRLAVRRAVTDRPIRAGYSDQGNVPPELLEEAFEQENFESLPDYMQRAVEQAVLGYYQDKDVRRIDYVIDAVQAEYNLACARKLNSPFLTGLFKIQIDLTNIRTMLRLKFTDSEQTNVLLPGGYIELERFKQGLELGYEALTSLFFVTPYHALIETGVQYFVSNRSFLKIEQQCDRHLAGFLKTTIRITAGPQPIVAYLLAKENEIRTVRLILTAKKNSLETRLILDRIG